MDKRRAQTVLTSLRNCARLLSVAPRGFDHFLGAVPVVVQTFWIVSKRNKAGRQGKEFLATRFVLSPLFARLAPREWERKERMTLFVSSDYYYVARMPASHVATFLHISCTTLFFSN